jgi:hypothetical protein
MKCANCDKDAMFEYRVTHTKSIFYCNKDLPSFLEMRKKAGLLKITSEYTEASKSAIEAVTMDVSEVVEETPAPKKKATTKKKTS